MKRFLVIQASESGNPIGWVDPKIAGDINEIMDYYGIERFLDAVPDEADPNYWPERVGLLLEVRVLQVRPKEVVTEWEIV